MTPCSTKRMFELDRNAISVFWSLLEIWAEKGNPARFGTTRKSIAAVCNLGEKAITRAMQSLHKGRWIDLTKGREGVRTWYMVVIPTEPWHRFTEGPKRTHSKNKVTAKKAPQCGPYCGAKKDPPLFKREKGFTGSEKPSEPTPPEPGLRVGFKADSEAEETPNAVPQNQDDPSMVQEPVTESPPAREHNRPSDESGHFGEHPSVRKERELMEAAAARRRQAGEILTPDDLPENYRELYEERAGIREFDGNQSRDEAERAALAEVVVRMKRDRSALATEAV